MTLDQLTPHTTWLSLQNCRDLTRWLEGAGPIPVHTALVQLEAAPAVESVVAAVTFVGIRRQLLAQRRGKPTGALDLAHLRPSLTVSSPNEAGLAHACWDLIVEETAGRPTAELAERLHARHGLDPVLAMASFAKAVGRLLVAPPDGYSTYDDLYVAETVWMSRLPSSESDPGPDREV